MTILVIEGLEGFGTSGNATTLPTKLPSSSATLPIRAGEHGGFALECSAAGDQIHIFYPDTEEVVLGFNFKIDTVVFVRFAFLLDNVTIHTGIVLQADGAIRIERTATTLSTSATGVITAGTWHYIEFKCKINNTTGSYDCKVDGVSVTSGSSVDTQQTANAFSNRVQFSGTTLRDLLFDDIYILETGTSPNNDFLGPQIVTSRVPDVDDTQNFTRSTGSVNYQLVDDDPHDTDATYVESGTSTTKDLYDYATVDSLSDIKCVQISTFVRETDGTDFTLITPVKSNVTETDDSAQAIAGTSYENLIRLLELDPDTSVAWIGSGIDAAKFGIKVG